MKPKPSLVILLCAALAACHTTARPAVTPAPARQVSSVAQLQRDIDAVLAAPALVHGYWAVVVKSLARDETLYALNGDKLLMPASNMKTVTLAAAAERLGWDYTYATSLFAKGNIHDGVLDGDLLVVGSGDPSIGTRNGTADPLFADWAESLKSAGVRTIAGRIVGDDRAFDDHDPGFGWSWDDLGDDYAAGVGALQFDENAAQVTIAPGATVDAPAMVTILPSGSGLVPANRVATGPADTAPAVHARRLPGSNRLELSGSVPAGGAPVARLVSVDNPTLFFVSALRDTLIAHGIDVHGAAVDIDALEQPPSRTDATLVATHRSPPLSTLAVRLMKDSQNQYAETLLKTLGTAATPSSVLKPWGVAADTLIQRDGSGLSRYDYVTAASLVTILTHVARDERLRGPFEASLPIAGRDGTLERRMKGTAAEANARAKTGSMSNARSTAGFVRTADGEPLVFAIIANNFDVAPATVTGAEDAIVVRLATFQR